MYHMHTFSLKAKQDAKKSAFHFKLICLQKLNWQEYRREASGLANYLKHPIAHCTTEPMLVIVGEWKENQMGTNGTSIGNPWSTAPLEQTLECCLRSTSRGRSLCLQNRAPEQFGVYWKMIFSIYVACMYMTYIQWKPNKPKYISSYLFGR